MCSVLNSSRPNWLLLRSKLSFRFHAGYCFVSHHRFYLATYDARNRPKSRKFARSILRDFYGSFVCLIIMC
jgi:hypothetical protein